MTEEKNPNKIHTLPVLPLRGLPVFPDMIIHFDVGRDKSISALNQSMTENQLIFLLPQKDEEIEFPEADDLCCVGTIARIKQVLKFSETDVRVLVEGVSRGTVVEFTKTKPYFECIVKETRPANLSGTEKGIICDSYVKELKNLCGEYFSITGKFSPESLDGFMSDIDPEHISDIASAAIAFSNADKLDLLQETDVEARLKMLVSLVMDEIHNKKVEREIDSKVKRRIDKGQREFFLREQVKVIQDELGEGEDVFSEIDDYITKLENKCVPEYVLKKAKSELNKLKKMQPGNPEGAVIRDYVQWLVDVPWTEKSQENTDLKNAESILNEDHYGLEKVKERIVEFMAVRKLSGGKKSPILCLVGPPGVGKTSVAKSVAKALGRKYVRMSLGGVKDEAEIRGHRKTYIGAMPGRIVNAMKQAGTTNPLILLDEIDKLSADYKGNPSAALLEVLDSEQNHTFRDHYLEIEYDLSDVLFITTANTLDTIDRPLLDRMEVIELSGYTDIEKEHIVNGFIIPKLLELYGLKKSMLKFADGTINDIINSYTREAGVRELERRIEKIFRKASRAIAVDNKKSVTISRKNLEKYLDKRIFTDSGANKTNEVGVVTGLAWTQYGGDILFVEAGVMEGSGNVELTGQLGDVMKESAKAAVSYIRTKAGEFGIDKEFYKNRDIHIHVPEGAVPKDGPSAGITMTTALVSALSGRSVSKDVAMTGEITLSGKILPIGGLKEKSLAAYRAGIKKVLIPSENQRDLTDIPQEVRNNIEFIVADNMNTVLKHALIN